MRMEPLMEALKKSDGKEMRLEAGEKIYVLERTGDVTPVAFIRKGIVFVSTDADSARTTLDRLDAPTDRSGAGADLGLLFSALPEDQALRGALTNRA